jgi:hypothetical protein
MNAPIFHLIIPFNLNHLFYTLKKWLFFKSFEN